MSNRTPEELAQVYRGWPTEKLIREIGFSSADYTEVAIQAMRLEVERRNLSGSEIENTVSRLVKEEIAEETSIAEHRASPRGRSNTLLIEGVVYLALGIGLTVMTNRMIFFWGAIAWGIIRLARGAFVRLKK